MGAAEVRPSPVWPGGIFYKRPDEEWLRNSHGYPWDEGGIQSYSQIARDETAQGSEVVVPG